MEALGINIYSLTAYLVNFVLLVVVLNALLYRRIGNMLNERRERIAASLREAEQVKVQLARANEDYEARMSEARQQAASLLAQAQERAKAQEEQILATARREAEAVRTEARQQALQERDQLMRDARRQIAELVTLTASRVLEAEVRAGAHDRLIDETLAEFGRKN